jgi:hypothetical protein
MWANLLNWGCRDASIIPHSPPPAYAEPFLWGRRWTARTLPVRSSRPFLARRHVGQLASLRFAELREKARAEWLEFKKNPAKGKTKDKNHDLAAGDGEDRGKAKDKGHSREGPDDDFGM